MAFLDSVRERIRGQRKQPAEPAEDPMLDSLTRARTAEEADAYRQGEQMGAANQLMQAGWTRRSAEENANHGMTKERLRKASEILLKYQAGKASVDMRVLRSQQWWKLNNWQEIRKERGVKGSTAHPSNTGWLWNCIVGKHADFIDSSPEPIILPRAEDDRQEAKQLSKIVPVVMEMNDFEETYNACCWQKPQEGTGVYGVFWNSRKLNGLGDIDIKKCNMLNLFWEPGVEDIQDSANVFYVNYEDKEALIRQYPELKDKQLDGKITVKEYKTDDNVDKSDKVPVIDWYYKTWNGQREILQLCKYVGEYCLYSSEEEGDPEGYYHDGKYPFELDALFPVAGSPAGYGYIDIAKDAQADIDTLSQAMVKNAVARATPRYFTRKDGGVNEEEFLDMSKPLIHTNGNLGTDTLRPWEVQAMGGDAHNMLQQKVDEIKFITGNTDVNNGGVPSGVTAASAIAALREDSGRSSKDSTKAAYRSYRRIVIMVIERIRQFYDIPRQFRIIGEQNEEEFVTYSNAGLQRQMIPNLPGQEPGMRLPVFDIEVRAQRESAYTKLSNNELALQFYDKGLLSPQMTDQALIVLDMMDFRGKEELRRKIAAQGTMQETLMKLAQIALALAQKYEPMAAQGIAQVVTGVAQDAGAGQALPAGRGKPTVSTAPSDATEEPMNPKENGIVKNAKLRAEQASRPD